MSSLDRLRSFAEARRCPDHAVIQAGLTYGDARMLFTGIECMRAELAEAEQQRDAARLELRALEWLTVLRGEQIAIEGGEIALLEHDDLPSDGVFATYASAARALGWEG